MPLVKTLGIYEGSKLAFLVTLSKCTTSALKMKVVSSLFDVRDFPVPGKKENLWSGDGGTQTKKSSRGLWKMCGRKKGEPEPKAGQGWWKSSHTAGAGSHVGESKAKGAVHAQGFTSAWI